MLFFACLLLMYLQSSCGDLNFLAIADWGGMNDAAPTTWSQVQAADGMQAVARQLNINFTLLLGDNMYLHGIACSAAQSTRFRSTFHDVYATRLAEMPFYVVAGNHDYGEGRQANVSAQLAYSKFNPRWVFPSLWYKVKREFIVDGHVRNLEILMIDTVVLCGRVGNEHFIHNEIKYLRPDVKNREMLAEEQWEWLEQELNASSAHFLWVSGHYPVWSTGIHGSSRCLIDRLLPLLGRYNAQYVSGHDHMLEHIEHSGINNFVVGAGVECCYWMEHFQGIPPGGMKYVLGGPHGFGSTSPVPFPVLSGFGSFRLNADWAHVTLHAHDGTPLYTAPPIPRRRLPGEQSHVFTMPSAAPRSSAKEVDHGLPNPWKTIIAAGVVLLVFVHAMRLQRKLCISKSERTESLLAS